jgi:type II secretory pathway component PulF
MNYAVEIFASNKTQILNVEADNKEQVPKMIFEEMGLDATIVDISLIKERKQRLFAKKKVAPKHMEMFCRQLHTLISSGMPLLESISTLKMQAEDGLLKKVLSKVETDVKKGLSLADSMKAFPHVFDSVFCGVIKAAEETGKLEESLAWLADSFKKEQATKTKMRQALTYPAIVLVMTVALTIGLFTFVVPKFTELLISGGIPIPFFTRMLMTFSDNFPMILAVIVGLIIAFTIGTKLAARRFAKFARFIEKRKLSIPVFGKITMYLYLSKMFWIMGMLLRTGVNTVRVLDILAESTKYITLKEDLARTKVSIKEGNRFSDGFKNSFWVRHMENNMLALGETSGRLDSMASHVAELLEKEVDSLLARMPTILETSVVVIAGGLILMVMLAVMLPMVSMYQLVV